MSTRSNSSRRRVWLYARILLLWLVPISGLAIWMEVQTLRATQYDQRHESEANLKQLAGEAILYSYNHHGRLPNLSTPQAVIEDLFPYVKNYCLFRQPNTKRPYEFNQALSRRSTHSMNGKGWLPFAWEPNRWPDGTRACAFIRFSNGTPDLEVRWMDPDVWQQTRGPS